MLRVDKTVFISYRRTDIYLALAITQSLTHNGFDVFLDYQGIASGDFEQVILENIRARGHFLLLLTPSALERCDAPGDWFRREIEEALETRRNIVPLMMEGFTFSAPAIASKLTGKLGVLQRYNGLTVPSDYFDEAMTRLRDKFLNVPLEAVIHPASEFAQQVAKDQQAAAAAAPPVEFAQQAAKEQQAAVADVSPIQQQELTAQEWFKRGLDEDDSDEKIRCFTEAIRAKPNYAEAYYKRGEARYTKDNHHAGAIKDYTAAIRLKPQCAEYYDKRGEVRYYEDDHAGAIEDYTTAIRLKPECAEYYCERGDVRYIENDHAGAIEDYTAAIRLKPECARAYHWRGMVHYDENDHAGAIEDYTAAIRLRPAYAQGYHNRGIALKAKGDMKAAQKDFDMAACLSEEFRDPPKDLLQF